MAQWSKIHLPMQERQVQSLVWENPTCCGAAKPVHHSHWACALETTEACARNQWACALETSEACAPRACASQEKPRQVEAQAPQLEISPHLLQLEKAQAAAKTQQSQK